ncbi:hypothetical protein N184_32740 [Sinorhizobium sp. GL28]|nr:hypothetical protein N184_32740 [Sinorhizobium sp. GL28]
MVLRHFLILSLNAEMILRHILSFIKIQLKVE